MEGYVLLCTSGIVGYSGFCATSAWFQRQDDFGRGVPGPATASSATLLELRQRQLIAVLLRGSASVDVSELLASRAQKHAAAVEDGELDLDDDEEADSPDLTLLRAQSLDLGIVEAMYEKEVTGLNGGPLLRLFLAQYIRWGVLSTRASACAACCVLRDAWCVVRGACCVCGAWCGAWCGAIFFAENRQHPV